MAGSRSELRRVRLPRDPRLDLPGEELNFHVSDDFFRVVSSAGLKLEEGEHPVEGWDARSDDGTLGRVRLSRTLTLLDEH